MTQTHNIEIDYLAPSQAQKHVTVNDAFRRLDIVVQPAVLRSDLSAPPSSPASGDSYVVSAPGTDAWSGHDHHIAAWVDGLWLFAAPKTGWQTYVADQQTQYVFDGTAWQKSGFSEADLNNVSKVGINAAADTTNRLAVKSDAILFDHAGSDSQIKINKNTAADSASLLFQNGYSGKAELGLTGDNDVRLKVSADGANWRDAVQIDATDGVATFQQAKTIIAGDTPQLVFKFKENRP